MPAMGLRISEYAYLGFGRLRLRVGSFDLRLGGGDLRLFADGVEVAQVFLGGVQLGLGLGVLHLGFVHLAAREGPLREELLAAFDQLLRGVELLLGGLDIGLGFDRGLRYGGAGGAAIVGFGLRHLRFVGGHRRFEVAILESGQKLSHLHVVAAIGVELLHGRADLGHHGFLLAREEGAVTGDDAADSVLSDGGDLHGSGRFDLGLLLLMACGGDEQAPGEGDSG